MKILQFFFLSLLLSVFAFAQAPVAAAKTFTRTLYLVRHGQYDADAKAGKDGPGISPLGIAQAKLVATRLQGLPVMFTSLTASTMTRARETAMFVNQSLPALTLETTPLLRETTPRAYGIDDVSAEDFAAAGKQLDEAFATFFVPATKRDAHDILVCHGNVIRYLVTKALGVDTQSWATLAVAHCSLTIVQVRANGTFRILAVGDSGHIPPNLLSGATAAPVPALVVP